MNENKLTMKNINKLIWIMGVPMLISMVLQAIYNVVDTIFVINSSAGIKGNLALTAAFPVQILIIAIGVGTGVGINAMLSKNLGEGNKKMVNAVVGNGIFIALCIYVVFLLFGLFLSRPYMKLFSSDLEVIEMGTVYLQICCMLSLGSVGFTVYERFLQATGRTGLSMIAQASGAVTNIILDAVFVFSFGVAGAAWATIIGQFVSLIIAAIFHYHFNKEIDNSILYLRPDKKVVGQIYKIGLPAAIMQGLLAVMMFLVLQIMGLIDQEEIRILLMGSFGIYYKIMQMALFAAFGLSNTLITITSFNYGMNDKERINNGIKYGIINTAIVMIVITILFQLFAYPLSELFGMASVGEDKNQIINTCKMAIHIASIGYVFMGISVAIQGILQGLSSVVKPVIISLLRLVVLVIPLEIFFILLFKNDIAFYFWFIFPVSEIITAIISIAFLKMEKNKIGL